MGISNEDDLAPDEAARLLAAAVGEAGKLALSMREGVRSWQKDAGSPVSDADIAADNLLRQRLMALAPSYGWLSEETADQPDRLLRKRIWVVDPIDGTRAYLANLPDWSVSAALVENGRPLAAALYVPVSDEMFVASKESGTTQNGITIISDNGPYYHNSELMVIMSYWKDWYYITVRKWIFLEAGEAKTTIDSHHAQVNIYYKYFVIF